MSQPLSISPGILDLLCQMHNAQACYVVLVNSEGIRVNASAAEGSQFQEHIRSIRDAVAAKLAEMGAPKMYSTETIRMAQSWPEAKDDMPN